MNPIERKEVYRQHILLAIPHLLSALDRDQFSYTYGSFDREYWAWATKDFSNIDLQRAVYSLSLVYLTNFKDNVWYRSEKLLEWVKAGIAFWVNAQHIDGSFDHHYPNEYSFVGVAFTLYEISQAYDLLVRSKVIDEFDKDFILAIQKAANFLCETDEYHGFISNHRLGAACALYSVYLITKNEKYLRRSRYFIKTVEDKQSTLEGWLFEYGGADPGYQTLDTYYLANYYELSSDDVFLENVIKPSVYFIQYFIHPDGSIGGEYGSRNCPLFFPSGFELLAKKIPEAEAIITEGVYALKSGNLPALSDLDIRNFVPMFSSYMQSMNSPNNVLDMPTVEIPYNREFERYWPDAGIYIRSTKNKYFIVGLSKGGVVKVFDKNSKKLDVSHCGYMMMIGNRWYSNQFLSHLNSSLGLDECAGKEFVVNVSRLFKANVSVYSVIQKRIMTQSSFLLFRLFNYTFGRVKLINDLFRKYIIVGAFINRRKKIPTNIERTYEFSEESLKIIDDMSQVTSLKNLNKIYASDYFTAIYMASSKYYGHSDLVSCNILNPISKEILKENNNVVYYFVNFDK